MLTIKLRMLRGTQDKKNKRELKMSSMFVRLLRLIFLERMAELQWLITFCVEVWETQYTVMYELAITMEGMMWWIMRLVMM